MHRIAGIAEAFLDLGKWLAVPPVGERDLVGARAAFREAINARVQNARLALVEFIWFHCRETATAEEQAVLERWLAATSPGGRGPR